MGNDLEDVKRKYDDLKQELDTFFQIHQNNDEKIKENVLFAMKCLLREIEYLKD